MTEYEFKCPKCGYTEMEEVRVGAVVTSELEQITVCYDGELAVQYGDQRQEGGEVDQYQCRNCGEPLRRDDGVCVRNDRWLGEWLKKNGTVIA